MKLPLKIIFGILAVASAYAIYYIITDSGGLGFYNLLETFYLTGTSIFLVSLSFLLFHFGKYKHDSLLWLALILSSFVAIPALSEFSKKIYYSKISTNTPKEFLYETTVSNSQYLSDKLRFEKMIDSLYLLGIYEKPDSLALRSFNGKKYHDAIERGWAIELNHNTKLLETKIDTLFYSKDGKEVVAGLIINKVHNSYKKNPKSGVEYEGTGFIYKREEDYQPIKILVNHISQDDYPSTSKRLRQIYFINKSPDKTKYNMNDVRFLYQ